MFNLDKLKLICLLTETYIEPDLFMESSLLESSIR